jgi:hypothetical protein
MADFNVPSETEMFRLQFWREAAQLRVAMPGVIRSFDADTQTATVQPSLKLKVNVGEGVSYLDLPVIQNVPVVLPFAQTAGLLLTLPIKPGDECMLVFSDRAIDFFVQSGGMQQTDTSASADTTSPRGHNLTDAMCIPGIISNPQAVPKYSTTNIEMRDRERKHFISLGPDGITISDSVATWNMAGGKVTLNAPAGIEETAAANVSRVTTARQTIIGTNIRIGANNSGGVDQIQNSLESTNGTFIDKDGVVLNTHVHNRGSEPDK